jgi:hypothetical protein
MGKAPSCVPIMVRRPTVRIERKPLDHAEKENKKKLPRSARLSLPGNVVVVQPTTSMKCTNSLIVDSCILKNVPLLYGEEGVFENT